LFCCCCISNMALVVPDFVFVLTAVVARYCTLESAMVSPSMECTNMVKTDSVDLYRSVGAG